MSPTTFLHAFPLQKPTHFCRKKICALVGSAVALLSLNSLSNAQEIQEIVVSGSMLQNTREIEARRQSMTIVDSLSQDDIGALPDVTIAESLRRIAGVTTIYNDDIGQFASVRGIDPDLVPITFNGLTVATTGDLGEGSRRVNLQVIPGQAVKQLQVFKSFTADQESGALGGYINMVPLSAFDGAEKNHGVVNVSSSYSTYMDVPDDNSGGDSKDSGYGMGVDSSYSTRFGEEEQFGVVVSASWNERPRTQSNITRPFLLYFDDQGGLTDPESPDWNGYTMPDEYNALNYTNKFENKGGTINLEYQPTDNLKSSLFGYAYFATEQETRNRTRVFSFDQAKDQTATSGTVRNRQTDTQWRYNTFERDNKGLQWDTELTLGQLSTLRFNTGYSSASFLSERPLMAFRYTPNKPLGYDTESSDQPFTLTDPEAYINPENFTLFNAARDWRDADEDVFDTHLDYSYNSEPGDLGLGFQAGLAYREMELVRDITSINYKRDSKLTLGGISFVPDFIPPGYPYPVLWIDQETFWNETVPQKVLVDDFVSAENSYRDDYSYTEDVFNVYGSVSYTNETFFVKGGLRLDRTELEATMAQISNGVLQPDFVTKKGDYSELLPYLSGLWRLTDKSRIKFGASETLGRPNPNDIAAVEQINQDDFTISRGNADLKPRQSTNLDAAYEFFFNNSEGMFTLSAFYKDVKDDILRISSREVIGGANWEVTSPINGETTTYRGLELGLVNNTFGNLMPALDRLGASANMIYAEGETAYYFNGQKRKRDDLMNQMKWAGNAAVFYDIGEGSEVRLAYNYQSEYVDSFGAVPWEDVSNDEFDTVDLTLKWAISQQWMLRLEGRNIFSNNRNRLTGPNQDQNRAELEIGSSWFLHLTYLL